MFNEIEKKNLLVFLNRVKVKGLDEVKVMQSLVDKLSKPVNEDEQKEG